MLEVNDIHPNLKKIKSIKELVNEFGLHPITMTTYCKDAGINTRPRLVPAEWIRLYIMRGIPVSGYRAVLFKANK